MQALGPEEGAELSSGATWMRGTNCNPAMAGVVAIKANAGTKTVERRMNNGKKVTNFFVFIVLREGRFPIYPLQEDSSLSGFYLPIMTP